VTRRPHRRCWHALGVGAAFAFAAGARPPGAEGAAEPAVRAELTPVDLLPPKDKSRADAEGRGASPSSIRLRDGRWTVKIKPVYQCADSVPWEIIYEPDVEAEIQDFPAEQFDSHEHTLRVPVLKIPDDLWDEWFDETLQDVAGIHLPYMGRMDLSHILFTSHHQPAVADGAGATEPASRIEATLLVPITWMIDQVIIVRKTSRRGDVQNRIEHERAHATTAVTDLVEAITGPQTWEPATGTGRRSNLVWWWRYEKTYRTWGRYREGKHKVAVLRTYVTVLPPTRWSQQFPKPKGDITPADALGLNRGITRVTARYNALRASHQREVHKTLGDYERRGAPRFQPQRKPTPR